MLNLVKAVITLFGSVAVILAILITAFLVFYIGYLAVFLLAVLSVTYFIKILFDTSDINKKDELWAKKYL